MTGSRPARAARASASSGASPGGTGPQAGAPGTRTIAKAVPQAIRARRAVSARSGMGGGPACMSRPAVSVAPLSS